MNIYIFLDKDDEKGIPPLESDAVPSVGDQVRLLNLKDNKYTMYEVENVMWSYLYNEDRTTASIVYVTLKEIDM